MQNDVNIESSYDIFISYRRSDGVLPAKFAERYLSDLGLNVFLDLNIRELGEFPDILRKNLRNSKNFILIITPDVFSNRILNKEDWVAKEIALALELNKSDNVKILPILTNSNIMLPNAEELPDHIRKIVDIQTYEINFAKNEDECKNVLRELIKHLNLVESSREDISASAIDPEEIKRLLAQINNSLEFDKANINFVLNKLSKEANNKRINVLDIGCARGDAGQLLFTDESFSKVLGIDKNDESIKHAEWHLSSEKFSFETLDLEDDDFESKLSHAMKKNRIEKFDLIYASMVLHYINNPLRALRKLYDKLADGGYIIVKASDDGSKIAYDDGGLMEDIISLTMKIPDMADREFGRKIHKLLCKSGFKKIKMISNMRETSKMNRNMKEALFFETFSWRLNECCVINKQGVKVPVVSPILIRNMKRLIEAFKDDFMNEHFWYCDFDYVGIGKKINEHHDD